eukprot:TRINITY_DN5041_c0_g1_i1.p1 TRINITY_DN5041_c0_g1~~TRINITY_DN5041_c0_g1_i1.p1  ORF type:complete len:609 (-),score=206.74 TRINITY_DN5041_c0_g1_i1:59-1720(-)
MEGYPQPNPKDFKNRKDYRKARNRFERRINDMPQLKQLPNRWEERIAMRRETPEFPFEQPSTELDHIEPSFIQKFETLERNCREIFDLYDRSARMARSTGDDLTPKQLEIEHLAGQCIGHNWYGQSWREAIQCFQDHADNPWPCERLGDSVDFQTNVFKPSLESANRQFQKFQGFPFPGDDLDASAFISSERYAQWVGDRFPNRYWRNFKICYLKNDVDSKRCKDRFKEVMDWIAFQHTNVWNEAIGPNDPDERERLLKYLIPWELPSLMAKVVRIGVAINPFEVLSNSSIDDRDLYQYVDEAAEMERIEEQKRYRENPTFPLWREFEIQANKDMLKSDTRPWAEIHEDERLETPWDQLEKDTEEEDYNRAVEIFRKYSSEKELEKDPVGIAIQLEDLENRVINKDAPLSDQERVFQLERIDALRSKLEEMKKENRKEKSGILSLDSQESLDLDQDLDQIADELQTAIHIYIYGKEGQDEELEEELLNRVEKALELAQAQDREELRRKRKEKEKILNAMRSAAGMSRKFPSSSATNSEDESEVKEETTMNDLD